MLNRIYVYVILVSANFILFVSMANAEKKLCFIAGLGGDTQALEQQIIPALQQNYGLPMLVFRPDDGIQNLTVQQMAEVFRTQVELAIQADPTLRCIGIFHSLGGIVARYSFRQDITLQHPTQGVIPLRNVFLMGVNFGVPHLGFTHAPVLAPGRLVAQQLTPQGMNEFNLSGSPSYSPGVVPYLNVITYMENCQSGNWLENSICENLQTQGLVSDGLVSIASQDYQDGFFLGNIYLPLTHSAPASNPNMPYLYSLVFEIFSPLWP